MSPEHTAELWRLAPNLYADREKPMTQTLIQSIDCGDGWFPLLAGLSSALERLIDELPEAERGGYRAEQVKEKFGGLRFYMSESTHEMDVWIKRAEQVAACTCELCGRLGESSMSKITGYHWVRTLCPEHMAEYVAEKAKPDFYPLARAEAERLIALDPRPGTHNFEVLAGLAIVIDQYEQERFPIAPPTPEEAAQFRAEQEGKG